MENRIRGPGKRARLRGRASELALLDDLVVAIRGGESRSLLLRGEAGIGKTALLECLIESATDLTVIRAVGVETEMELAFAGLHQVCGPMLDHLERLPDPQRDALQVVFGIAGGSAPNPFLVGLAVLSLLSEAAEKRPLLLVVDDAQWLDRASALALAFVARRVLAEPIGMVFAAREPDEPFRHLRQVEVPGLSNADANALLKSSVRFMLDERVRARIVAETHGNPLALLELPRGLTAMQLAGGFTLPSEQPLSASIEASFVRQLEPLSHDARRLVLLAAAEPIGDPILLARASERLGIALSSVDAETATLLVVDERVTFRHPLVRSAAYRSAQDRERRAVHMALAEVTDREHDPDRRAWHLAAAASGPDEEVAFELERSAGRARGRGGLAAAAAFLQRAVALTQDPARRADRALNAAQASLQAGAFDAALELLVTADAEAIDDLQRAQVDLLRARVAFSSFVSPGDIPRLLLKAARRLEPFDLELARETYLMACGAAFMAGDLAAGQVLREVCRDARSLPPRLDAPRPLDLLLDGLTLLMTEGHAAATPTLQRAAKALADICIKDVLQWGWVAPAASAVVWDVDGMRNICARQVDLARDAGALDAVLTSIHTLGLTTAWMGDFAETASLIAEAESVASAIGSPVAPYALMRLLALQGREHEALPLIAAAVREAAVGGQPIAAAMAQWAAAVLHNGRGHYQQAASAAHQATSDPLNWWSMWALPELVEAAARTGNRDVAHGALERLARTTQPCRTEIALGLEARSQALLSDGETADHLHREAIQHLGRTTLRPELARAHLLYGEWLRRSRRTADAAVQLRAAHEQFTTIGMEAFADRARSELLAIGERSPTATVKKHDDLTPQERQIARLARDGLSNPEIGARLFLSPRTVEWHLGNAFSKLGIRSRRDLSNALESPESESSRRELRRPRSPR